MAATYALGAYSARSEGSSPSWSTKINIHDVIKNVKFAIFIVKDMRTDILSRKDEVVRMVEANEPKSAICRLLGCKPITLNSYLSKMGITYEGNMGMKGKKQDAKRKTATEYISTSSVVSSKLRKKLIEDGIKKGECEMCGNSSWLGNPLPLELHHIDGDHHNNQLTNLQDLCPNCHSLTPNHSRRKDVKKS